MLLVERIEEDLKNALRQRESLLVDTLRLIKSAIKNAAIEKRKPSLDDQEAMTVLRRELKKRQDSIAAYQAGQRLDLAEREAAEAKIIQVYLPAAMSQEDLEKVVTEVMASGEQNFGLIMKAVMAKTQGSADGQAVQALVKAKLGK